MADSKVTGLDELTDVASTDVLYIVDDPGGSPVSKKATAANVVAGGLTASAKRRQVMFTVEGAVGTATGKLRLPNQLGTTLTIEGVYLHINTAPLGTPLIVDLHVSGTTCFTTQTNRPQIGTAAYSGSASGTVVENSTWADGAYLTMDVDQVGSSTAGSDLSVTVVATE